MRDLLLLGGFLWLAWSGARHIPWYGVVAMPMLAEGLDRLGKRTERMAAHSWPGWATGVVALVILAPLVLTQPWLRRGSALVANTPVAAARHLQAYPGGRLFNEMGYGSYLIWALPEQPVFIDPRMELFPERVWIDYIAIAAGQGAVDTLSRYGIDRVLLRQSSQAKLAAELAASGTWEQEYVDGEAEIWRRVQGT
jgi:hypothetical protein